MIHRDLASELIRAATRAPSVLLAGPRQSGKTTLSRALFASHPYRTLEAPDDRAFAVNDPRAFLAQFPKGAVIAEVQRVPSLIRHLQGTIDADPVPGRWILTSSQDLAMLAPTSQSQAGRTEVLHLLPLTWNEIARFRPHPANLEEAMFSGGYPSILDGDLDPPGWLRFHVADYTERDVRTIGNVSDLATFQRFLELCAGRSSQLLNYSSLAGDCGISQPTAKAWMGILESSFVAFRLPAFHADLGKRLVKAPKMYFYDTGLLCWLLGIREPRQLRSHPLRRSIFETWVVSEIVKHRANRGKSANQGQMRSLSFYRDRNGAEVDLVIERPEGMTLVDVKAAAKPSSTLFRGAERVRGHFKGLPTPDVAVVYSGEGFRSGSLGGKLVPWWRVRAVALR